MDLELRPVTEDEFAAWSRHISRAFHDDMSDDDVPHWRAISELDRSIGAFDGGEIVGTAGAFTFDMAVPGGATIGAAGVTAVSVRPTHRRRGVLTSMMARQLADVAERGEPVAVLTASETPIYGRFGYGLASQDWAWSIDSEGTTLASPSRATGRVRLIEKDEAAKLLPDIRERVWRRHPGEFAWTQLRWDDWLRDSKNDRGGASERRYAVHESEHGEPDGYVAWNAKPKWENGLAVGTLNMLHLYGFDGDVEAALLEFLLAVDLKKTVAGWTRPVDDPLRWRLADFRRMKVTQVGDHLWLRILDVERTLAARELGADDRLVIEVVDRFRPQTAGAYAIEPGACRRSDAKPDLVMDVRDLGALYLGTIPATTLQQAGRIQSHTAGAAKRADKLFASIATPWCATHF